MKKFNFRFSSDRLAPKSCAFFASGFSLVELLVALVVGLLIILAGSQLFLSLSRVDDRIRVSADRQESVRYLYDSLVFDVRNATALSYNSSTDELVLQFAGFVGGSECSSVSGGYSKIYHYVDGDEGVGIYSEVFCYLVGAGGGSDGNAELIVPGSIAEGLTFSFLPGLYGLRVNLMLADPAGRLPDESLVFYVANRNRGANAWQ